MVPPLNPSKDFSNPRFWVLSYDRPPLLFSNSASFSTKGIKRDIICFYRARLLCETAHRGTTRNLRNRRNLKKNDCFYYKLQYMVSLIGYSQTPIINKDRRDRALTFWEPLCSFFKYTEGAGLGVPKPPRKVPSARQPGSAVPPSAVPHISLTRCYRRDG